jgi:hypothetical protein
LKTPKTIALLAVPAVLAAAVITATGAFAKSPSHAAARAASVKTASVKLSAFAADTAKPVPAAPSSAPAAAPSKPSSTESATESAAEAAEPASTETDTARGHADDPNDPNADHQFNGEE